ncbi:MAG: PIN domain-containing protein [Microthrixaceae bacterium]|jgi:predicted nucleic acid-binding protein|nr:PIN domain-containing protein [Microthrixaceae bacterium]
MGLTVLDSGVLIGFLDSNDAHHPASLEVFTDAHAGNDRLVLPASALAEILVGPSRRGTAAVGAVRELLDRLPIEVEPVGSEIAIAAAALRARHRSVKLPDALVIATAAHLDADLLVTTDRGWPTRAKLGLRGVVRAI